MNKNIFIVLSVMCMAVHTKAQDNSLYKVYSNHTHILPSGIAQHNIVKLHIPLNTTTHFVSPEPIDYVDISTPTVQGDLTEDNLFRIRPVSDVVKDGDIFTLTVVTKSFIIAYEVTVSKNMNQPDVAHIITINPNEGILLNQSDVLSKQQCFDLSLAVYKKKKKIRNVRAYNNGLFLYLNGAYVFGDYILLDLEAILKSRIPYSIENVRFKITDKKQLKATVQQDIEIEPYYALYPYRDTKISDTWRNMFVFKKFTYPTQKVLQIELTEEQYSGRNILLEIPYNRILSAIQL